MLTALERLRKMDKEGCEGIQQNRPTNPTQSDSTKPCTAGMTLAQFAQSGRALRIYSNVLGEEIIFAADNAYVSVAEPRTVYRPRELAVIWGEDGGISAEGLRLLHEVKARFGAEITAEAQERNVPCLNL